jgi:hypothetical protein
MMQSLTPGPGQYNQFARTIGTDSPMISMKGKAKNGEVLDVPGPGTYDSDFNRVKSGIVSFKLGTSTREGSPGKLNRSWIPGPGTYNQGSLIGKNSPSITIGGKTTMIN